MLKSSRAKVPQNSRASPSREPRDLRVSAVGREAMALPQQAVLRALGVGESCSNNLGNARTSRNNSESRHSVRALIINPEFSFSISS